MGSGYWRSAPSMLGSNSLGFLSHQIDPKIVPCLFFSSMIITNTYFINMIARQLSKYSTHRNLLNLYNYLLKEVLLLSPFYR